MADEADLGNDEMERRLVGSIEEARYQAILAETKKYTHCLYCHAEISAGRFCDSDCSSDYGWMEQARRAGGLR